MKVLVTGGSGLLGPQLARATADAGHSVRLLTRRAAEPDLQFSAVLGDLATGSGLAEAVRDVDAVLHAASDPRHPRAVDVDGTRRLLAAAGAAGVGHFVYVSIVGVDRIPLAYYRAKREAERLVTRSGMPFSIVRATQFHPFVARLLAGLARVPLVLPVPAGFVVQPVDVADVAGRLARQLTQGPSGVIAEFGGPDVLPLPAAARTFLAARGRRLPVVTVPLPGATAAAFRAGYNVTRRGETGVRSWRAWLRDNGGMTWPAASLVPGR